MVDKDNNYSTYWDKSELHNKAEIAREEERYEESLNLIKDTIADYKEKKNHMGVVQAYQTRCLVFKHLYLLHKSEKYKKLAKKDAEESLKIAKENKLTKAIGGCFFRLAEIEMLSESYEKASVFYKKALEMFKGSKCEKGDFIYHLGEALYKAGKKKEGKEHMLNGLKLIQDNRRQVNEFLANVWESGCYIRLADSLRNDEPKKAKEYILKAQEIIMSDSRLVIRKRQIEKLAKEMF